MLSTSTHCSTSLRRTLEQMRRHQQHLMTFETNKLSFRQKSFHVLHHADVVAFGNNKIGSIVMPLLRSFVKSLSIILLSYRPYGAFQHEHE